MRRVKCTYNRYVSDDGGYKWEPTEAEGYFHCWGSEYEEFEAGVGNTTIALVELDDGTIVKPLPEDIQFLNPTEPALSYPYRHGGKVV